MKQRTQNQTNSIDKLRPQEQGLNEFIAEHLFLFFPNYADNEVESKSDADYLGSKGYKIGELYEIGGYYYYKLDYTKDNIPERIRDGIHSTFVNRKSQVPDFSPVLLIQNESCKYFALRDGQISKLLTNLDAREITEVHFLNVNFQNFELQHLETKLSRLLFSDCRLKIATIWWKEDVKPKVAIEICRFSQLTLRGTGGLLNFSESTIELLIADTTAQIECANIKELNLFLHNNLELGQIGFTRVNILYDQQIIQKYLHIDTAKRYLNSFVYIRNLTGLRSEQNAIDRYINYFRSREDKFHKLLFWFNGGYFKIIIPLIFVIISMILSKVIVDTYNLYPKADSMSLLFNPKELMTEVILKDFNFNPQNIYLPRFFIAILAVSSAYSLFCFLAAVRKRYGFQKFV